MLKDNRLLIGLGIGLIIGAVLLELMNVAMMGVPQETPSNEILIDENIYTVEQLENIADALDYKIIEKSLVYFTQADMDEAILKAQQSVVTAPTQESVQSESPYSITITYGMGTENVVKLILEAGIIEDEDIFMEEMRRRKLNNIIQVGTFEFDEKPSLTELIDRITSRN